jgi:hypothetical protein
MLKSEIEGIKYRQCRIQRGVDEVHAFPHSKFQNYGEKRVERRFSGRMQRDCDQQSRNGNGKCHSLSQVYHV